MSYVRIENIISGYNKEEAPVLNEINATGDKGDFIGLLGKNGSGKSTLLKVLGGLKNPWSGKISIDNSNLYQFSPIERSHQISLVLTDNIYGGVISVEELVSMGRYPHLSWNIKMSEADREIVENAILTCEIEAIRKKSIHELSDGQKQKVMIARALAQDTPLLLLDEPTNHLDIKNKFGVMKILAGLAANGKCIIMTSHDIELVRKYCSKLWLLSEVKGITEGKAEELIQSGEMDIAFDTPVKALLDYTKK